MAARSGKGARSTADEPRPRRGGKCRIAAGDDLAVGGQTKGLALPIRDDPAGAFDHRHQGAIVVGLELAFDDEIDEAAGELGIGIAIGAVARELDAGFEPLWASNAEEAISILESRDDIRIVFTDINMPGSMDGLKLARAVRERWPPIQLIVTSGHFDATTQRLPAGSRFLGKPYTSAQINTALVELTA